MADSFIQVAPDSTGKKLQTVENTVGADSVHAEAVVLVDQFGVPLLITINQSLATGIYGYDGFVQRPIRTDPDGYLVLSVGVEVPVVINTAVANSIGKQEDAASGNFDGGIPAMAIRKATPANTSDTDGDYEMLQMDGGKLWVKGPLTDTEIRATPLPVSGTVTTGGLTDAQLRATAVPVSGPLTDAQLRATAVPVSGSFSLPAGAATEAKQDTQIIDLGGVTETAPASDTASSGLNGRLQRIAQRITSFIALFPASIGIKTTAGSLSVTLSSDHDNVPVEDIAAVLAIGQTNDQIGANNVAAAASDTATSPLNGRLQRIAQRITSLITALGSPFQAGGSIGNTTFASTQSGTWTVQPGNTANTTAWKVDGSAVTQPVSAASLPLPAGAATAAKQPALGTALASSTDVLTTQRPAITQVVSTAFEASHVLKASAGQLVQLSIFNSGPAQFILLMNSTTVPANGAVTLLFPPIPIAAATLLVLDLPAPLVASTGIAVCNSSTGTFTKTIGAADCAFYAQVN